MVATLVMACWILLRGFRFALSMFLLVSLETFALEFSVTEGTLGPGSCPFLAIVGPWPSLVCAVAGGDGESR